jgi:TIR domain-containing protein
VVARIFLSHSDRNRRVALRIAQVLRGHGVDVWFSRHELRGSQQWHDEIGTVLGRCNWFVLLLSRHSVRSLWVKRELTYALRQRRYQGRIVPVLLERCDWERLSWTLGAVQRIEGFLESFPAGCRELLRVWRRRYRPRPGAGAPTASRSRR